MTPLRWGYCHYNFTGNLTSLVLTVDDTNPALPLIRNIPEFPEFRVLIR